MFHPFWVSFKHQSISSSSQRPKRLRSNTNSSGGGAGGRLRRLLGIQHGKWMEMKHRSQEWHRQIVNRQISSYALARKNWRCCHACLPKHTLRKSKFKIGTLIFFRTKLEITVTKEKHHRIKNQILQAQYFLIARGEGKKPCLGMGRGVLGTLQPWLPKSLSRETCWDVGMWPIRYGYLGEDARSISWRQDAKDAKQKATKNEVFLTVYGTRRK